MEENRKTQKKISHKQPLYAYIYIYGFNQVVLYLNLSNIITT